MKKENTDDRLIVVGREFNWDKQAGLLKATGSEKNDASIPLNQLKPNGNFLSGFYSHQQQKFVRDDPMELPSVQGFRRFHLPIEMLNPEMQLNDSEKILMNARLLDRQAHCQLVTQHLSDRLDGMPARIRMLDIDYDLHFDVRQIYIANSEKPAQMMLLPPLRPIDNERCYYFLHSPSQQSLMEIPQKVGVIPADAVVVRFPNISSLDPIGIAKALGMEKTALLSDVMFNQFHQAKVFQIGDTALPKELTELSGQALRHVRQEQTSALNTRKNGADIAERQTEKTAKKKSRGI